MPYIAPQPGKWTRARATAFIIRLDPTPTLLVLEHVSIIDGWYLPGGGIKPNEPPFDALMRELREETGLDVAALRVVRKLDVFTFYKAQYDHNIERHDFVLIAPPGLPESWRYITVSDDDDNGEILDYVWITPEQIMGVHPEFAPTITPGNMPELFS